MKTFGGTCPVCCGDMARGRTVCQFCRFRLGMDATAGVVIPVWLRAHRQPGKILVLPVAAAPPSPIPPSIQRLRDAG